LFLYLLFSEGFVLRLETEDKKTACSHPKKSARLGSMALFE